MHHVLHELKRAYYNALRSRHRILRPAGLTAARFDLLQIIERTPEKRLLQSELRRELGTTAATVSRMVDSLEELGLLRRRRHARDTRQRIVQLTALGRSRVRRASDGLAR